MKKINKYECVYVGERGVHVPCHLLAEYIPWSKRRCFIPSEISGNNHAMLISGHACQKNKNLLNWRRFFPSFFSL